MCVFRAVFFCETLTGAADAAAAANENEVDASVKQNCYVTLCKTKTTRTFHTAGKSFSISDNSLSLFVASLVQCLYKNVDECSCTSQC